MLLVMISSDHSSLIKLNIIYHISSINYHHYHNHHLSQSIHLYNQAKTLLYIAIIIIIINHHQPLSLSSLSSTITIITFISSILSYSMNTLLHSIDNLIYHGWTTHKIYKKRRLHIYIVL